MKKNSFLIKFSSVIIITIFFLALVIMNFIMIPKTFNTISQVNCITQEDESFCSLIIIFDQEIKNKINNRVITIYFVKQKQYKQLLANNWINNQLVVLEQQEINYFNQEVIVTYNYESLLSYILNNIS